MDLSTINISKNTLHTHSSLISEQITDKYHIMGVSKGEQGKNTNNSVDMYKFDSDVYELGDITTITSFFYTKRIIRHIKNYLDTKIYDDKNIKEIILSQVNKLFTVLVDVKFYILVSIFNFIDNQLYIFNIGDCGYIMKNVQNKNICMNSLKLDKDGYLQYTKNGYTFIVCICIIFQQKYW